MKQLFTILTLVLLSTIYSQGQTDTPLDLVKTIFSKEAFPNLDKHITGNYKGHPNGMDLPTNASTNFLLLEQKEKTAVVNVTIIDSLGSEFDAYLHLEKDTLWKITAFRALAMTGIAEGIHAELKSMTKAEIDEIIELSKSDTLSYGMFKSRMEYEHMLGETGLIIASDNELIAHFNNNRSEFEFIKNSISLEVDSSIINQESKVRVGESLKSNYHSLYISSIKVGGFDFYNSLNFVIGGMLDNIVGYLYVQNKEDLPSMNPNRIIMIREIGDGWYLYKTT